MPCPERGGETENKGGTHLMKKKNKLYFY